MIGSNLTIFAFVCVGVVLLVLLRVPIAFAFATGSIVLILLYGMDFGMMIPSVFHFMDSFALLAMPMFIFLGLLLQETGLARRLIDLVNVIVGRVKGGLGLVVITGSGAFGAISGSASSCLVMMGTVMFPRLVEEGYPRNYSVGIVLVSSILALFIPPSMNMIMFGFAGGISIATCFLATVGPGLLLILFHSIINLTLSRKFPIKTLPKSSFKETVKQLGHYTKRAAFVLLLPFIVLGGIYGGVFTPTESAAAGIVFALLISVVAYKSLTLKSLHNCMVRTVILTATIMTLLFCLLIVSRILVWQNIIDELLGVFLGLSSNFWVQLFMLDALLILMGMFIDDASSTILGAILLLPVATGLGVNPYHFAGIVMCGIAVGGLTPPVASNMYYAGTVMGGVPLSDYFKYCMIFLFFSDLPTLFLTTFIPEISTFLPNLVFGTGLGWGS